MESPKTPVSSCTVFESDEEGSSGVHNALTETFPSLRICKLDEEDSEDTTPRNCASPGNLRHIDGIEVPRLAFNIEEDWKPGEICANIQVHDTYNQELDQEILIEDRLGRRYQLPLDAGSKYVFVFIDSRVRLYITHPVHRSAIKADIDSSKITADEGILLSNIIEFSQSPKPRIQIPVNEWTQLLRLSEMFPWPTANCLRPQNTN